MKKIKYLTVSILTMLVSATVVIGMACTNKNSGKTETDARMEIPAKPTGNTKLAKATFAMGCFWHSEEMFSELKGVVEAVPGYSGGKIKNPTYEEVSTGTTGHAESVDISYDPNVITYEKLLEVFFAEHDPTTPNYADPDEGPQYRSVVFYRTDAQKQAAEKYISTLNALKKYKNPIITQVVPFDVFYKAEDYHIHYYRKNPNQGYISTVTRPEVEKFRKDFKDWLK